MSGTLKLGIWRDRGDGTLRSRLGKREVVWGSGEPWLRNVGNQTGRGRGQIVDSPGCHTEGLELPPTLAIMDLE